MSNKTLKTNDELDRFERSIVSGDVIEHTVGNQRTLVELIVRCILQHPSRSTDGFELIEGIENLLVRWFGSRSPLDASGIKICNCDFDVNEKFGRFVVLFSSLSFVDCLFTSGGHGAEIHNDLLNFVFVNCTFAEIELPTIICGSFDSCSFDDVIFTGLLTCGSDIPEEKRPVTLSPDTLPIGGRDE